MSLSHLLTASVFGGAAVYVAGILYACRAFTTRFPTFPIPTSSRVPSGAYSVLQDARLIVDRAWYAHDLARDGMR